MKVYLTEFIGTFFLVLVIALTGSPLAIGAALTALVYMGGYISGAHYNPAVTLGLLLSKKIKSPIALRYMIVQLIGAICAAGMFYLITGSHFTASIAPKVPVISALLIETVFTFLLVTVVLNTAATDKTKGNDYYGAAIGLTVMAAATAGGGLSGGAFNPAVGLGPILFDIAHLQSHLVNAGVYFVGPFLGGAAASVVYKQK